MTPKMRNLKKHLEDQNRKISVLQKDLYEATETRWIIFMRFSTECGERHTSPSFHRCMADAYLTDKSVKDKLVICSLNNCPRLRRGKGPYLVREV